MGAGVTAEMLLQVLVALGVGAVLGLEREFRTGNGLRTLMLICLGATLFTLWGEEYAQDGNDPSRITTGVVSGVGFLGAAMILRHRAGVFGFTTAAAVWLSAALGVGIGLQQYLLVIVSTAIIVFILWGIPLARNVGGAWQTLAYEALGPGDVVRQEELHELLRANGLNVVRTTLAKESGGIRYTWQARGRRSHHQAAMAELIANDLVLEFAVVQFDELS